MRTRRRLFALAAAFAVAFGSLWPLVSAAAPRSREIPNIICTQSGFQHPGAPAHPDDKFHCPLCVTSVESAPPVVAPAQAWIEAPSVVRVAAFVASARPAFLAQPPPSRAPPSYS
jgi:hypothetical protein